MSRNYYEAIVKKINSGDKQEVNKGMEAAIVYLTSSLKVSVKEEKSLMEYIKKDLYWLDEYCNKKEPSKEYLNFAVQHFEKKPESIFKYQALAHRIYDKESRKVFVNKHRDRLIKVGSRQSATKMFEYLEHNLTQEDVEFIAKELTSQKVANNFFEQLMIFIKNHRVEANQEDIDIIDSVIVMNELFK